MEFVRAMGVTDRQMEIWVKEVSWRCSGGFKVISKINLNRLHYALVKYVLELFKLI